MLYVDSLLSNNIIFRLYSLNTNYNALMGMTVTYIIAQISTFNSKLMFYQNNLEESIPRAVNGFITNFGIPSVYNSNLTQKCIIGLTYIVVGNGGIRPS